MKRQGPLAVSGPWHRLPVNEATMALNYYEPGMRCWQRETDGGHLTVLVARCAAPEFPDGPRWHLSISHRTNDHPAQEGPRLPTWEEISDARYRFVPDSAQMAMFLPPRAEYVNVHATTMHLWEVPPGEPVLEVIRA